MLKKSRILIAILGFLSALKRKIISAFVPLFFKNGIKSLPQVMSFFINDMIPINNKVEKWKKQCLKYCQHLEKDQFNIIKNLLK